MMPRALSFLFAMAALVGALHSSHATQVVKHRILIRLDPEQGVVRATDRLSLPPGPSPWSFALHPGLNPKVVGRGARIEKQDGDGPLEHFRLVVDRPGLLTLRYEGRIRNRLEDVKESLGRSHQTSRGTVIPEGVVLAGGSGWYPRIEGAMQIFSLSARLPKDWMAVSQGAGPTMGDHGSTREIRWREDHPQEDIDLIAGHFTLYRKSTPIAEAQVYLRTPDQGLATPYLEATAKYLAFYSALIGSYPYAKFALVENFWETGYGMPSFTLLGPEVIRLPFIIHTSYPHEILHNWWGNGVYVDYGSGNWSEGLTAYLADYLLKEERGEGEDYRHDTLKAYADYVGKGEDFPIRDFHSRHSSASQAIGYGKTLMVFHMLRRDLGDKAFILALRRFYRDNRFRVASFDDLRRAFEQTSGRNLTHYFQEWIGRTGAPGIALTGAVQQRTAAGWRLRGRLAQTQAAPPFPIDVPLVVHLTGGGMLERRIHLAKRNNDFELALGERAIRVDADPRFDLFRRLEPGESPATLSSLFGSGQGLIVLPAAASGDLARGYRALAMAWTQDAHGWKVVRDADLTALPEGLPVWLLGWTNRFLGALGGKQKDFSVAPATRRLSLAGRTIAGSARSVALARGRAGRVIGWVAVDNPAALPGLARKLPHYGKYSYLVFTGLAPENQLKGQWPVSGSNLMVWLAKDRPPVKPPPARAPLAAVLKELPPADETAENPVPEGRRSQPAVR
jgi:aminopeptidase N